MPSTIEALLILLVLVLPGFVAARLFKTPLPNALMNERQFLVMTVLLGIVVHLIALPVTVSVWPAIVALGWGPAGLANGGAVAPTWSLAGWFLLILFVIPVVVALATSLTFRAERVQGILDLFGLSLVELTPQAWDWFFLSQRRGCWVVIQLDDGRLVGGEYGGGSFASLTPHDKDLYLEREYYVDEAHNFGDPIPGSIGVWLRGNAVQALHFYRDETDGPI